MTTSQSTACPKNLSQVSFPRCTDEERIAATHEENHIFFFVYASLHARSSLSVSYVSWTTHIGRLFAERSADFCSFVDDPLLSYLSRMSENTSSIATSRPVRATRGAAAASSSNKVTVTVTTKPRGGAPPKKNGAGTTKKKGKGKGKEQVYCVCRGKDHGSPMICCGACREW